MSSMFANVTADEHPPPEPGALMMVSPDARAVWWLNGPRVRTAPLDDDGIVDWTRATLAGPAVKTLLLELLPVLVDDPALVVTAAPYLIVPSKDDINTYCSVCATYDRRGIAPGPWHIGPDCGHYDEQPYGSLPRPGAALAVLTSEHPVVLWRDRGTLMYAPIHASGLVLWKQHDEVDSSTFDQNEEEYQLRTRAERALHTARKPEGPEPIDVGDFSGNIEWDLFADEGCTTYREAAEKLWEKVRRSPGPVVELTDSNGCTVHVDLSCDPGDGDVEIVDPGPRPPHRETR